MSCSRAVTLAKNWKKKQIDNALYLRDQMIENKISQVLIDDFLNKEYERINKKYEEKIKKANNNQNENSIKTARKKAIEFIIKNKTFMEENNIDPEIIKQYTNKHYNFINNKYSNKNKINFID